MLSECSDPANPPNQTFELNKKKMYQYSKEPLLAVMRQNLRLCSRALRILFHLLMRETLTFTWLKFTDTEKNPGKQEWQVLSDGLVIYALCDSNQTASYHTTVRIIVQLLGVGLDSLDPYLGQMRSKPGPQAADLRTELHRCGGSLELHRYDTAE